MTYVSSTYITPTADSFYRRQVKKISELEYELSDIDVMYNIEAT